MTDPVAVEQLLRRLAPEGAGVAACRAKMSLLTQLSASERSLVRWAKPVRCAEFAAGRACAHRALTAIGADAGSIGRGSRRQPTWPTGATGSISHAAGLAVAVASRVTDSVAALGIDLELADGLDPTLWSRVLTQSERARCEADGDAVAAATTVFSAKEAAFKALYPQFGIEVDFLDAHTELDRTAGSVDIPSIRASAAVRYGRAGPLVVALAVVAGP